MNKKVLSYIAFGSLVASLTGGCGQNSTTGQQTEAAKTENTTTAAAETKKDDRIKKNTE